MARDVTGDILIGPLRRQSERPSLRRIGVLDFLPDPKGKKCLLPPSSFDAELGLAAVEALCASRQIDPKNDPKFFDIAGRVVPQYKKWVAEMMERF
ncbi:MAG: contact-dependent growth inhibition system immunity protein [Achromobacter sp.]|uniref:contact-dependent growth inhibition system immunity protein n=1 Tax=Achromobacter sp. TaxID=134375 RepID=UPI003D05E197